MINSIFLKVTTCLNKNKLAIAVLGIFIVLPCTAAQKSVLKIPSDSMGKTIPAMAILPDSYPESAIRYPVVYLLHGKSGAFSHWQNAAPLQELSDQYQIIIICPDGDKDSWYLDAPDRADSQYMTHVVKEVVSYVDANLRTEASPKKRAISGNSMGGHGALLIALKHPDVFGAAGSMSGVLDLRPFAEGSLGKSITKRIGSMEAYPGRWQESSVLANLDSLKDGDMALILECGTGDHFLKVNREVHQALIASKIHHTYIERTGGHNWGFWKTAVQYQALFFHQFFTREETP